MCVWCILPRYFSYCHAPATTALHLQTQLLQCSLCRASAEPGCDLLLRHYVELQGVSIMSCVFIKCMQLARRLWVG
jgi:hypothetical protein